MGRVIIIGAGGVGSVVAHKCAQVSTVFDDIILASRTLGKCDAIAASVKERTGVSIRTRQIDADDVDRLVALFEEVSPELVINVALPYQDLTIMEGCLRSGVHYLDTANYESPESAKFEYARQWEFRDKFRDAGLTAVLGSGFDPGVTNVYTAWIAKHLLREIHQLDIVDVNGGDHGKAFATNFNPEINIREVTAPCRHWEDGRFVETPAMSTHRSFTCPEEVGTYEIYRMYHEELESLVKNFPSIRTAQFWMSFSQNYLKHLEVLQNVGMTRIDPVEYQGVEIVPLQFLKAVLPEPSTLGADTRGRTCIGVIAEGTTIDPHAEGDGRVYLYNICDHQEAYREVGSQAISYTTGVPAMIGAKMILQGTWRQPGVWNMEEMDPDPFMEDLNRYGLPWTVQQPSSVSPL